MNMRNTMKRVLLSGCLLLCGAAMLYADGTEDLKRIKENYRSMLIPDTGKGDSLQADWNRIEPETEMSDQMVVELHQRYPFDLTKIEDYLS